MNAFYNVNGQKFERFINKHIRTHITAQMIAEQSGVPLHKVRQLLPKPACLIMPGARGLNMWRRDKVTQIFGVNFSF